MRPTVRAQTPTEIPPLGLRLEFLNRPFDLGDYVVALLDFSIECLEQLFVGGLACGDAPSHRCVTLDWLPLRAI